MAMRTILTQGEDALAKKCRVVTNFDARLHTLLDDMKETLIASGGAGLAAPQVGVLRRVVVLVDYNKDPEEIVELVKAEYDRRGVPLKPFVPEIFEVLEKMNVRCALVTSTSSASVEDYLRRTGIARHFESIVTGDRVKNGKPAPDCFLLAAKEMGLPPADCLVAEDSPTGIEAARRAGMQAVMIPDLIAPTDEVRGSVIGVLDTLEELPDLITKENEV